MRRNSLVIIALLASAGILTASSSYTGYSGAPAANGTCTSSCHAQNSFTPSCEIAGFPEIYVPGQQYTITVRHADGASINQFNCSIRKNSDSTVAGLLEAGEGTAAYSTTNESNGIHWLDASSDSGTFLWTAPDTGTGYVTLYWAGLQGSRAFGADQQIVLESTEEGNGINYVPALPAEFSLAQNYPNPFNSSTVIDFRLARPGDVVLEISNILGQKVYGIAIGGARPGHYKIGWNGTDEAGRKLPSGLYFYRLLTPEGNLTRKLTILN